MRKASFQILVRGAGHIVRRDTCFVDREHRVDYSSETPPDFQRMKLQAGGDLLWCPIGQHKITPQQLLNVMPIGKRKTPKNQDVLLHKFNCRPELRRLYVFESGDDFETQGFDADLSTALELVRPSPKQKLRGCLIEAPTLKQAKEILKEQRDDLPWRELHGKLRADGTLDANWHGGALTLAEQTTLKTQKLETLHAAHKERAKLISRLRNEANLMAIKPL